MGILTSSYRRRIALEERRDGVIPSPKPQSDTHDHLNDASLARRSEDKGRWMAPTVSGKKLSVLTVEVGRVKLHFTSSEDVVPFDLPSALRTNSFTFEFSAHG